jgi:CubicO group peptidase (beta-lactamase class C family)
VRRLAGALIGLSLVVAACSSGDDDDAGRKAGKADEAKATGTTADVPAGSVYPGGAWTTADAADLGFDQAKLDEIAAAAEADKSFCLVVTRHGKIAAEWNWGGNTATTTHEVFSATKSYSSTLVGIAQAEGKLDIGDKASKYIPEWAGTDSDAVTVKDLLSNDSGRHWDFRTDYQGLIGAADRTAFGVGLTQDAPPGTVWAYNNSAIQTLEAVLEQATGEQPADYAKAKVFDPIGMDHSHMTLDNAGNTNTFFGLQSTCQDMARFGYLFLRKGNWDGEQLVPAAWVDEATGKPSQELNAGYGYLWWLNRIGPQPGPAAATDPNAGPGKDGQAVPGAPEDMFWAIGLGNQIISVDPGSDTVVVRIGPATATGTSAFGTKAIARVVTEALVTE